MTWTKLDDQFFAHPKVVGLSKDAKLLYLAGLTYCSAQLTDGQIGASAVRLVAALADVSPSAARELEAAGLWEVRDGGYTVHDYLDYNPAGDAVKAQRAANAQRQAEWRDRKARNAVTNAVSNAPNNGRVTLPRTRPGPGLIPGPGPGRSPETDPPAAGGDSDVREVFAYYKQHIQPRARLCPTEQIRARLKRFSVEELQAGIDHFAADAWWMSHNRDRGAQWFFKTDARSEQFLLLRPRVTVPERNGKREPIVDDPQRFLTGKFGHLIQH